MLIVDKVFSIYRSSAGSGKTRTLAKEYLKLALQHKSMYFQYILAVTFTNKASQEMKDRILFYLNEFATGCDNELAEELMKELGYDRQTFQERSHNVQTAILHGYSQFSISTIDAFFQKVIRSFTRESGLVGDYRLEVEQDAILEEVIDNLIDELGTNAELTEWVVEFAKENLENEKAWDVRHSLIDFSKEIFREEFKSIESELNAVTNIPGFFKDLKNTLWKTKTQFISKVSKPAREALEIIQANGWTVDDFSYGKNSGLLTFFSTYAYQKNLSSIDKAPGDRIRNHFTQPAKWPGKTTRHASEIIRVAEVKLIPAIHEILETYDAQFKEALTAETALKNLYVFGLIADIARKLNEYKAENNVMLLADAPKFLNGVIQDSDTPFIYEKVGSFYRNYLIDEFQDTSGLQWKNFQPLITNSLDQGFKSLVVGDVKQAIYRWRGGDLNLLQNEITGYVGEERISSHQLDNNFRSATKVVTINNEIFKTASALVASRTNTSFANDAYADVAQNTFKDESGFVKIRFIEEDTDKAVLENPEAEAEPKVKWKTKALEMVPAHLEALQRNGVPLKDIAILVRKNEEGQRVASHLLQYKMSDQAQPDCRYDVVSNESLRIDGASTVNLLVGAMQYLLNADNAIARAQLGFEFARLHEPERNLSQVFTVANQTIFENNLPDAFTKQKTSLRKLSVLELTETLIEIFQLGGIKGELIYLQAFEDLVLEFTNRERNDLGAFLEWWEENRSKKSVQISGDIDAAQILTIHKSKGLQFKFVIIPFCSWGLDHDNWQSPNLWVRIDKQPFSDAGFIPVKYTGLLDRTHFDTAYHEEKTRSYLDNLNLLYVALTRAESGMIVTAPAPKARGFKDSVAEILFETIQSNTVLQEHWKAEDVMLFTGAWTYQQKVKAEANFTAISLSNYRSTRWHEKLVMRKTASDYFGEDSESQRAKINYGVVVHEVLSKMITLEDLDASMLQAELAGMIGHSKREVLREAILSVLSLPQVQAWFSGQWDVRTEVPIVLTGGEEVRIDRLLTKDKHAIVIDFKTGSQKKSDNDQVLKYMTVLKRMNFLKIEGYIVYLADKSIIEVKDGKQKVIKKTVAKDQLTLGL